MLPDAIWFAVPERPRAGRCHREPQLSGIFHPNVSKIKHHRYSSRLWLLAATLAAALLLLFTKPAQAAEPVFVSNIDQASRTNDNVDLTASDFAQGFTTGGNTGDPNYDLGSIDFSVNGAPASVNNVMVKLYSSDDTGAPDAELCTLANPDNLETGDRRPEIRSTFFLRQSDCSNDLCRGHAS